MAGDFASNPSPYLTPASVYGRFERVMDETDPQIIKSQIAYGLQVEAAGGNFFNNFINNLPGDHYRSIIPASMLDQRIVTDPTTIDQTNPLAKSVRATQKTWQQFFGEVDQAIELAGLDTNQLQRLREAFKRVQSTQTWRAYTYYALPAYELLRFWGYSHGDLTR